jgi:hypothetical protein
MAMSCGNVVVASVAHGILPGAPRLQLNWGRLTETEPRPECPPERAPTIRITELRRWYAAGQEQRVWVPDWVGRIPKLVPGTDSLYLGLLDQVLRIGSTLGMNPSYVYLERPAYMRIEAGRFVIHGQRPAQMTAVELRSLDGTEGMYQEFFGHFEHQLDILRLLHARLGAELAQWRPHEVVYLNQKPL